MKTFGKLFGGPKKEALLTSLVHGTGHGPAATGATAGKEKSKHSSSNRLSEHSADNDDNDSRASSSSSSASMVAEIEENERYDPKTSAWSHLHLAPSDPRHFNSSAGQSETFPHPPLSRGWVYSGKWEVDMEVEGVDAEGWLYALNFDQLSDPSYLPPPSTASHHFHCRRKRWIRSVRQENNDASQVASRDREESSSDESDSAVPYLDASITVPQNLIIEEDDEHVMDEADRNIETGKEAEDHNHARASNAPHTQRRASLFSFATSTAKEDPQMRIRDSNITIIGRQMKALENECNNVESAALKEWHRIKKPVLQTQIVELEKQCAELKSRMESEVRKGLEYVSELENQLKAYTEKLEAAKKEFYFQQAPIILGQAGIYIALDDAWLEHASGTFTLDLIPSKDSPQIQLHICGKKENPDAGIKVRLKLEAFKLAGDKGKGVPKLNLDTLKVTMALKADVVIIFDVKTGVWQLLPKHFKLELISFKGPYGISRSIIGAVLSLVTPMLRTLIVSQLPHELGALMTTLPSPFSVKGEFDINGIEITTLSTPMEKSPVISQITSYSPTQLEMFHHLQKALDRSKCIRTMSDLLQYYRTYSKHNSQWNALLLLWDQSAKLYSEKLCAAKFPHGVLRNAEAGMYTISIVPILTAADDIRRKRLGAYFKLQQVDGQVSLNQLLKHVHHLLHRIASDASETAFGVEQARMMVMLDRIQVNYELGLEALKLVSKNIDFAQLKLMAALDSGPQGALQVAVNDIMVQAPVLIDLKTSKDKNLGHAPLVPYIINVSTTEEGDISAHVYHYSPEGLATSRRGQYKARDIAVGAAAAAAGGGRVSEAALASRDRRKSSTAPPLVSAFGEGPLGVLGGLIDLEHNRTIAAISHGLNHLSGAHSAFESYTSEMQLKRSDLLQKDLEHTLSDMPQGEVADTIVDVTATRPHISLVVDQPVTLKPGSELFTLMLGPRDKDWKPFGGTASLASHDDESSQQPIRTDQNGGCPIVVLTAPGIKFLAQVPKMTIAVSLPGLVRFVGAHFIDLPKLKEYLEKSFGGEIIDEQLEVGKLIVDRFAKYLLLPGLNIELNICGKIVALNQEIMIRLETPDFEEDSTFKKGNSKPSSTADVRERARASPEGLPIAEQESQCAIRIRAEINLLDLVEDSKLVEKQYKSAFEA